MSDNPIKSMRAFIKLSQENIRLFKYNDEAYVFVNEYILPKKAFETLLIHVVTKVQPTSKTYEILSEYIHNKLIELGDEESQGLPSDLAFRIKRKLHMPPKNPDEQMWAFAQGDPAMYYFLCYEQLLEEQNVQGT